MTLSATLNWFRHVGWNDANANGIVNSTDSFALSEAFDNLDLSIYRDGQLVAQSVSLVDSAEHLYLPAVGAGDYSIRVTRLGGGGSDEQFGVAWAVVPEPGTALLLAPATASIVWRRRRQRA